MATAEETLAGVVSRAAEAPRAEPLVSADSPQWLPELLRLYLRRVHGLLYRLTGNAADAQDLAQDVFLKAYLRRHQLRDPERVLQWLMRMAANTAIDFQRSRAGERGSEPLDERTQHFTWATPEQQVLRDERERRLHDALRMLSPKERTAIVLREIEGLTGAEVAEALGCSQITVRTHIASARIKLRRYFARVPKL